MRHAVHSETAWSTCDAIHACVMAVHPSETMINRIVLKKDRFDVMSQMQGILQSGLL
jgi:hypothetical protein